MATTQQDIFQVPKAPPKVQHGTAGWEERKRQRELLEARKAGTVAPETDEDGRDINPHIPQYISQRMLVSLTPAEAVITLLLGPWYLDKQATEGKGLKHQRAEEPEQFDRAWYPRGVRVCALCYHVVWVACLLTERAD
jgi:pre-mRNA-processing factor SLU7